MIVDARRHGVAAALGDEAGLDRGDHRAAEIDARHRAAGAGAGAVGRERDGEGRALEALAQAGGDEADDAGVPVGRGEDQDRRPLAAADLGLGGAVGLLDRLELDALALGVELVEPRGDDQRRVLVVEAEQPRAERGVADAAAGIDARADEEAEMVGD